MMQIRYCPNCNHQKRDDNFEINRAYHQDIGIKRCPECDSWLFSLNTDVDGDMEVTDNDENSIHDTNLKKVLQRSIEIIDLVEKGEFDE